MPARRWVPVDDWFASVGESWQDVARAFPPDSRRTSRHPDLDDDQEQDAGTPSTTTRTTETTRRPRP
jgi:hypothetical protein